MFKLKIADLVIDVLANNEKIKSTFKDYIISDDISSDIKIDVTNSNDLFLDIHDNLAKNIVKYDCFVLHGACILYKDNAYLFIAPSGTGKTTHINLWKKHINDLVIINGDKPIIRLINNEPIIYGTPWMGKERYGCNSKAKLKAVVILHQGQVDKIDKVDKKDYINEIFNQIYMPEDKTTLLETMDLVDKVFNNVDVYNMSCTMNDSAFKTCFKELVGVDYEG